MRTRTRSGIAAESSCSVQRTAWKCAACCLLLPEMCRALGQPYYEVDAAPGGESARCRSIQSERGRSFAEGQVRHVLQALIRACLEAQKAQ